MPLYIRSNRREFVFLCPVRTKELNRLKQRGFAITKLTTREKGQFSKQLCLFRGINNVVFKGSLSRRSKTLQGFCSFLDSTDRYNTFYTKKKKKKKKRKDSFKRQIRSNMCNMIKRRKPHSTFQLRVKQEVGPTRALRAPQSYCSKHSGI